MGSTSPLISTYSVNQGNFGIRDKPSNFATVKSVDLKELSKAGPPSYMAANGKLIIWMLRLERELTQTASVEIGTGTRLKQAVLR